MVDHLQVSEGGGDGSPARTREPTGRAERAALAPPAPPDRPRPHLRTLTLLVGRVSTIKLAYWAALTVLELALATGEWSFRDRFHWSLVGGAALTALALAWAAWSARRTDARLGELHRSIPTVATAFVAASVVATPASLPLLFIEVQRAGQGCIRGICQPETIWSWVAAMAIGTLAIPLVFALRMRPRS